MYARSSSAPTAPVTFPAYIRARSRSRPSLEHTRKPYRKYKRDPDNWHRLFLSFDDARGESMAHWLCVTAPGINYKTFYDRYQQWKGAARPSPPAPIEIKNPSLQPSPCHIPGLGDGRGGHNRKWTREQERNCIELVIKPAIEAGGGLSNSQVRRLCNREFRESMLASSQGNRLTRTSSSGLIVPEAPTGHEWLVRVKKENGLVSGSCKAKRQVHITDKSEEIARLFIQQVREAVYRLGTDAVIAMDETFWNLHPQPHRIVKISGKENELKTAADPKAGITTILTVSASGEKLPIMFIAKGKTMVCCEKLAVPSPHVARPTVSGWCRAEVMADYIDNIIIPYTGGQPCLLILDSYTAHRRYTKEFHTDPAYNIEFAFVPESMTATLSPLDVLINPVIKSIGRGAFREMFVERQFENRPIDPGAESWALATTHTITAFDKVSNKTVVDSFEKAIGLGVDLCRQASIDRERERLEREKKAAEAIAEIDTIMRAFV